MESTFKAGYESYFHNKGKYQNPHNRGTNEYNSFERGWTQAIKRSDKELNQTYTGLDEKPKSYHSKEAAITVNAEAYANRKGY